MCYMRMNRSPLLMNAVYVPLAQKLQTHTVLVYEADVTQKLIVTS